MADRPPLRLSQIDTHLQDRDARRLELGEAWSKEDYARIQEISEEMKKLGFRESDIRYEHQRADRDYQEHQLKEAARQERAPTHESTERSSPERDLGAGPQNSQARIAKETGRDQAEAAPEWEPKELRFLGELKLEHSRDGERERSLSHDSEQGRETEGANRQTAQSYKDLTREHVDALSPAAEKRELRFFGELKDEHSRDHDKERSPSREPGEGGQKTLTFFSDRDPSRNLEHER